MSKLKNKNRNISKKRKKERSNDVSDSSSKGISKNRDWRSEIEIYTPSYRDAEEGGNPFSDKLI